MREHPHSSDAPVVAPLSAREARFDRWRKAIGLAAGPLVALLVLALPLPTLSPQAARLAAILAWVITWWVSEAVPLPVTAMLGAALQVLLGVAVPKEALGPFADPVIFLFLGGFVLAEGMMVHGLDRRCALALLASRWVAGRADRVVIAFAALAAGLSMWLSNTATTAMLYPIALGVLRANPGLTSATGRRGSFATGLLLVCAYGSSIGGIGTPVGSPPNLITMGNLATLAGVKISFFGWSTVAVPIMLAMLVFTVLYVRLAFPVSPEAKLDVVAITEQRTALGRLSHGERNVVLAFGLAVAGWVVPGVIALIAGSNAAITVALGRFLPESIVALLAASLLFALPVDWRARSFTLGWPDVQRIDWGTLLLFGGGLSLGGAMFRTGLAETLGRTLVETSGARSVIALTVLFSVFAVYFTEVTSNTAAATMLVPLAIAASNAAGVNPVPAALGCGVGCSMAFMLPVATPPNAIVYGSGLVPITRMVRAGWWLNIAACVLVTLLVLLLT
jgi:sodium-dependent dicarboxylate transporter 2/3/5